MPKWPAGYSEHQLNAYRFRWIWTMPPSLQGPDPFLSAVQHEVCRWKGVGSGFAVGCCASQWWCVWVLENPMCAPLHPSRHASVCSPTLLILPFFVLFFIIIFFLKKLKRHQVGSVGHRCSQAAFSWVAVVVLHLPKVKQRQTLARRSFLTKVWHARDAEHRLSSFCPPWDAARSWNPSLGLGWASRKGRHWRGSFTGAFVVYRASESQTTGLLKHHSFSGSSRPVPAIWSLLVLRPRCSEPREGKAWGMLSKNNGMKQKLVYLLVGWSKSDISIFIFCNKTL